MAKYSNITLDDLLKDAPQEMKDMFKTTGVSKDTNAVLLSCVERYEALNKVEFVAPLSIPNVGLFFIFKPLKPIVAQTISTTPDDGK